MTAWCSLGSKRIIGPYFFDDDQGSTVTVNGENYLKMLKLYYIPALRRRKELEYTTFQQDEAPPHIANIVLDFIREKFDDRLISRNCAVFWPAYSPNLNPCDFFLWGYLKSKVYSNPKPDTIIELKSNIRREIRRINTDILAKVSDNFVARLKKVISCKGAWIEHTIYS